MLSISAWSGISSMFRNDAGKAAGSYILVVVAFYRCTRLKELEVARAKTTLAAWFKAEPERSKLPLPRSFVLVLADHLGQSSSHIASLAAFVMILMFDTLMRSGELFSLRARDIVGGTGKKKSGSVAIQIASFGIEDFVEEDWQHRLTKTGKQDDTVVLDDVSFPGGRVCHLAASRLVQGSRHVDLPALEPLFCEASF